MEKKQIQQANNLYIQVQVLIKQQAKLFLMLGKTLKEIRDNELYKYLGEGGFDNFQQFLNNPEIGLTWSTAYLYIRIYEYYIIQLQLDEAEVIKTPLNRLMKMLPHLKTMPDDKAIELIGQSALLTNYDFKQELKDRNIPEKPVVYLDPTCNKWRIEYRENQICRCDDTFHLTNLDTSL